MASTHNANQAKNVHSWEQYLQLRGESNAGLPDEALPPALLKVLSSPPEAQENDTEAASIDRLLVKLPDGSMARLRWERLVLDPPAAKLLEEPLTIPDWEFDVDDLAPLMYIPKDEVPNAPMSTSPDLAPAQPQPQPLAFECFVRNYIESSEGDVSKRAQGHAYSMSQWVQWLNVDTARATLLLQNRKWEEVLLTDLASGFADFLLLYVFPRALQMGEQLSVVSMLIDSALRKSSLLGLSQAALAKQIRLLDVSSGSSTVTVIEFYEVELARAYHTMRSQE